MRICRVSYKLKKQEMVTPHMCHNTRNAGEGGAGIAGEREGERRERENNTHRWCTQILVSAPHTVPHVYSFALLSVAVYEEGEVERGGEKKSARLCGEAAGRAGLRVQLT